MSQQDASAFDRYREHVDRPLTRLFREYGTPRLKWFVVGFLANLLAQTASLLPPVVLGSAIDALFSGGDRAYTLPVVPQSWIPAGTDAQFWFSLTLIVGAFAVKSVFTWIYGVSANFFAHEVMHAVRTDSFEKMQRLDMAFFDDKQTGEVMAILNNDAGKLEIFLDNALMNSLRLVVMLGGIATVLFLLNPQLAFVTLVAVPAMVGLTWWFMRVIAPRYRRRQEAVASFNTRIENGISGIELAKTTASEDHETDRVEDASHHLFSTTMDVLKLSYFYRPGMELLAGLSFAATFLVGGWWLQSGEAPLMLSGTLTVGTFVTFIFMTQRIVAPLAEVSNIVDQIQNAKASAERVFGLSDIPIRIADKPDAVELENPRGEVTFDGVSFAYPEVAPEGDEPPEDEDEDADGDDGSAWTDGGEPAGESDGEAGRDARGGDDGPRTDDSPRTDGGLEEALPTSSYDRSADGPVLEDIDFAADPGETVALVGSTGAGKSTAMKLLLRLYDVTEGAVRVDGHDVRDVTLASLRRNVGYVSQDTFLFDGTIAENIRYGRFDADREAVEEAARRAEAHEFIAATAEGYDTRVGERGVKLSGGQRQRIALARVFLQDPPMLILDEATSAVDTETELAIQRSLERLSADRTTFVIAHRLSTVVDADEIIVLADGRIVERGTHDDLVDAGGQYATLWAAQTGKTGGITES